MEATKNSLNRDLKCPSGERNVTIETQQSIAKSFKTLKPNFSKSCRQEISSLQYSQQTQESLFVFIERTEYFQTD